MTFSNTFFLTTALAGLTFIIAGILLIKFPPKRINGIYGYRTLNSMKSQEAWDFAQRFSGKELSKWGVVSIISSITGLILPLSRNIATISGFAILAVLIAIIIMRTESAIKRHTKVL